MVRVWAATRRFDVLCVVRDIVDPVQDQRLAEFVVGSHARSHPDGAEEGEQQQQVQVAAQDPDILPQDLLRKYITFAKQQIRPSLSSVRGHTCSPALALHPLYLCMRACAKWDQHFHSPTHAHGPQHY
jgi:hypothetical protein